MSARRTPIEEIQVVGRVLVSALARDISADCQNALQQMADAGIPLKQGFVEELHRSKELAQCLTKMPLARLAELRSAVGNAASSSIANMEIMGLWSFVHAATKELLPDTLDLQPLQEATAKAIADGIADAKESAASIGRLLLAAFHSSMALSSTVSVELQDAVKEMVEQGTPLAASMVGELKSHAHLVSQALPKDKLLELRTLCSHAISSEWGELEQFASQIKESINHIADLPLLDVVQQGVIDVYNSPLTRLIVQEGFVNLDKAFTESRESLDAAVTAIVNGASVGACTSFLAMLPPLLRFEILRDFCQTVSLVNLVVMLGVMLFSLKKTRQFTKNWLGTLTFSDTVRDILDGPPAQIIPQWDLDREIKHRVWHAFWKTILLSFKNDELVQRLHALEQAVVASGMQNTKRHWGGQRNEYVAQMRMAARTMLEGVDVYWNGSTGVRDRHLDSQTCFGKMYITPYPFHCVMVYDDAKDEAIIRDDKFSEFLFLNFSPAIMEKRLLCQKLRALSATGVQIYFSFTRQEQVTVEDGTTTRTATDAQGNSHIHTETRHTSVEFTCHYTMGVITVDANSKDRAMADGFLVLTTYRDGYGDAMAPHTGVVHHQTNRVAIMGPEHIGLTAVMQESPQLQHIFAQTQVHWAPALAELQNTHRVYRQQLIEKHNETNNVLGDGFWYFVYNNPTLSRAALERYLKTEEQNPLLRELPRTQSAALSFLYKRMAFVQSHRAAGFWFLFWDDVFARNGDMARLKPFKVDLDPLEATSTCYRVMRRDDLEKWLAERRLRGKPFGMPTVLLMRKTLFHDKLLTLLYEQLHKHTHPSGCAVGGSNRTSASQTKNPHRVVPWTTALETPS
ncbi:hypothetical protein FI667_g14279, partial [Globisporangium splendens]